MSEEYEGLRSPHQRDGGCMGIWPEKKLSRDDKHLLFNYAEYINRISDYFKIEFRKTKPKSTKEKMLIEKILGSYPEEEIHICGWADDIFPAFEAILERFGGYLNISIGAEPEVFERLKGHWHKIKYNINDLPPIDYCSYHLIDYEFVKGYFNESSTEDERRKYSLERVDPEYNLTKQKAGIKSPFLPEDAKEVIDKRIFTCEGCGYSAQVYGESYFDFGCYNYIATLACKKCKELFEMLITKMIWDGPDEFSLESIKKTTLDFDLIDREEMICLRCGTTENHIWNYNENVCPRCKGKMKYEVTGKIKVKYEK